MFKNNMKIVRFALIWLAICAAAFGLGMFIASIGVAGAPAIVTEPVDHERTEPVIFEEIVPQEVTESHTENVTKMTIEPHKVPMNKAPIATLATESPTEPEVTEPEVTEPVVDPEELEMLALVIFQEAGGDAYCDECRRRVADVALNRVADDRYPDTLYGVLTQRAQYGRLHWTGLKWPDRASSPYEADAVARAYRIAEEVLLGNHSDLYGKGYIYQAEFVQGKDNIYHCGHYFGR